jgi:hypothetical protein
MFIWSSRWSSFSWNDLPSRPTVDTKYPRAQKLWPAQFCFRSPFARVKWITLLPLINPTAATQRTWVEWRNTTWYLHSHFVWLKLSYLSIQILKVATTSDNKSSVN